MNILVTNIGRRVYFLNFLLDIKKKSNKINIHLADNSKFAPTLNYTKIKKHKIPLVSDGKKKYLSSIKKIVIDNNIDLIIPLTNYDLEIFAAAKKNFKKLNCKILISSLKFIRICLDKNKTFNFCYKHNIKSPKCYNKFKDIKKIKKVFIKKDRFGNSSNGLQKINIIENHHFKNKNIIQDYIKGQELHFDILNDFNGNYISSCVKKKISMRAGETDKAQIIYQKKLENLCIKISRCANHVGNLDCDAIMNKRGDVYLLDFNPRFGGGYAFTHLAGMNFLKKIIFLLLNKKYVLPKKPKFIKAAKEIGVKICK